MAIDKAVDSSVLEAGLTTIANAIREKGGTSETLAFPDAMAEAIAAIEAGGGNVYITIYTAAKNSYNVRFTDVTFEPNIGLIAALSLPDSGTSSVAINAWLQLTDDFHFQVAAYGAPNNEWNISYVSYKNDAKKETYSISNGGTNVYAVTNSNGSGFVTGCDYAIILARIEL